MLLNVLRARDWLPRYYTDLTQITGTLSRQLETTLGTEVGSDASSKGTISAKGTYGNQPSMSVAVLGSQKFTRGITQTVPLQVLKHFIDDGWPPELVFMLTVRRIDTPDGKIFNNHPGDADEYGQFVTTLESLIKDGLDIKEVPTSNAIGPKLVVADIKKGDYAAVVEVAKTKAGLDEIPTNDRAKYESEELDKESDPIKRVEKKKKLEDERTPVNIIGYRLRSSGTTFQLVLTKTHAPALRVASVEGGVDQSEKKGYVLYLRSPESILYYLGQHARITSDPTRTTPRDVGFEAPRERVYGPIFNIRPKSVCNAGPLAVTYRGQPFVIPDGERRTGPSNGGEAKCDGGFSTTALTFVTELFALQKESDELPSTGVVRVIP